MKSEKVRIEVDLLRDSLRNIFVVMFAIMSGEVTLIYRILHNVYNMWDIVMFLSGVVIISYLVKIQNYKKDKIKELLERLQMNYVIGLLGLAFVSWAIFKMIDVDVKIKEEK